MSAIPVSLNLGKVPAIGNGRHVMSGGTVVWLRNGKKHRDSGPAEVNERTKYEAWFRNGLLHRDQGPAVTHPNGAKEFWKNGKFVRKEDVKPPPK